MKIYFRLIAVDSNDLTSEVVQVTVVLCPNCVNGFCNVDTAEEVTENLQNAGCSCDRGWTGKISIIRISQYDRCSIVYKSTYNKWAPARK